MSWLSICFIVSRATPTAMSSVVPAKGNRVIPQTAKAIDGSRATKARNSEPGSVMRLRMPARYFSVGGPGLMPGMNPPCYRMMSACWCGSNVIAV